MGLSACTPEIAGCYGQAVEGIAVCQLALVSFFALGVATASRADANDLSAPTNTLSVYVDSTNWETQRIAWLGCMQGMYNANPAYVFRSDNLGRKLSTVVLMFRAPSNAHGKWGFDVGTDPQDANHVKSFADAKAMVMAYADGYFNSNCGGTNKPVIDLQVATSNCFGASLSTAPSKIA